MSKNPPAGAAGREALGRSRGGLSTTIHLAADRRCRPLTRILTPGQHGDYPAHDGDLHPPPGQRPSPDPAGAAMGDKAYSSAANRGYLRKHGIKTVIPVKEDQKARRRNRGRAAGQPAAFDRERYKDRNTVERCFSKLKQYRAVATRYDQREFIYQGTGRAAGPRHSQDRAG